jgi:uncharacterized protein (UPF0305 family)
MIDKILKEFEDKLLHEWVNQIDLEDINKAKSFLRTSLESVEKQAREEVVREVLEKIKILSIKSNPYTTQEEFGRNTALAEVKALLDNMK